MHSGDGVTSTVLWGSVCRIPAPPPWRVRSDRTHTRSKETPTPGMLWWCLQTAVYNLFSRAGVLKRHLMTFAAFMVHASGGFQMKAWYKDWQAYGLSSAILSLFSLLFSLLLSIFLDRQTCIECFHKNVFGLFFFFLFVVVAGVSCCWGWLCGPGDRGEGQPKEVSSLCLMHLLGIPPFP